MLAARKWDVRLDSRPFWPTSHEAGPLLFNGPLMLTSPICFCPFPSSGFIDLPAFYWLEPSPPTLVQTDLAKVGTVGSVGQSCQATLSAWDSGFSGEAKDWGIITRDLSPPPPWA